MEAMKTTEEFDIDVRLAVYNYFIGNCRAPGVSVMAQTMAVSEDQIAESFRRLASEHKLVLAQDSTDIRMAMPFSAIQTAFAVASGAKKWWACCIWDALGVAAILHADVDIQTSCGHSKAPLALSVKKGKLVGPAGESPDDVVHFAVPFRRWWDDVGFT